MSARYIVCDTSMLDSYLKIPGKDQYSAEVLSRMDELSTHDSCSIYLPWAAIIECGNHIVQMPKTHGGMVHQKAKKLSMLVRMCLDGESPFSSLGIWDEQQLRGILSEYPENAISGIGMGDTAILSDCRNLCKRLQLRDEEMIELWTYDRQLENRFLSQRSSWMVGATGQTI